MTSDGVPGENSPFARRLIKSLERDSRGDGVVTSVEIFAEVDVPGQPEQPMHGTLPRHELGGDFLFIRR